jgi:SAM-dependent methyltransferase
VASGRGAVTGEAVSEPDYFEVRRFRSEVAQKYLAYPLTKDRDGLLCERLIPRHRRILEIGAGDRPFYAELAARGFKGVFRTMDVDRKLSFDYYSVDAIDETFDAVIMREVIEHLPRQQFYVYLERIYSLLTEGGLLALTTPNPWSPGWIMADYTHISPWPPADLYGVLRCYGFQSVEIVRVIWPSRFLWLKRLYWAIHSRLYDLDFAGSYIALAQKA